MLESIYFAISYTMVGLIWTIQWLHYPSFQYVDEVKFKEFHKFHSKRISHIVSILMPIELFIAAYLYLVNLVGVEQIICLAIIWLSTIFIQIPQHNKLQLNNSAKTINSLVKWNWLRTIAWTLKAIFLMIN